MEGYYLYYIRIDKNDKLISDYYDDETILKSNLLVERFKKSYENIISKYSNIADGEITITTDNIEIYNSIDNNKIKHKIRLII